MMNALRGPTGYRCAKQKKYQGSCIYLCKDDNATRKSMMEMMKRG